MMHHAMGLNLTNNQKELVMAEQDDVKNVIHQGKKYKIVYG